MAITRGKIGLLLFPFIITAPLLCAQTFTTIDVPGAMATSAAGINSAGDIVGSYYDGNTDHGFLLKDGTFTTIDVPTALSTDLVGINDAGEIVGIYVLAGQRFTHGFMYDGKKFKKVDFPGATSCKAIGINNAGTIVGLYDDASPRVHGFELKGGTFRTIDPPGNFIGAAALGINNHEDIVGTAELDSAPREGLSRQSRDLQRRGSSQLEIHFP